MSRTLCAVDVQRLHQHRPLHLTLGKTGQTERTGLFHLTLTRSDTQAGYNKVVLKIHLLQSVCRRLQSAELNRETICIQVLLGTSQLVPASLSVAQCILYNRTFTLSTVCHGMITGLFHKLVVMLYLTNMARYIR